jgi:hypothetical protein
VLAENRGGKGMTVDGSWMQGGEDHNVEAQHDLATCGENRRTRLGEERFTKKKNGNEGRVVDMMKQRREEHLRSLEATS